MIDRVNNKGKIFLLTTKKGDLKLAMDWFGHEKFNQKTITS